MEMSILSLCSTEICESCTRIGGKNLKDNKFLTTTKEIIILHAEGVSQTCAMPISLSVSLTPLRILGDFPSFCLLGISGDFPPFRRKKCYKFVIFERKAKLTALFVGWNASKKPLRICPDHILSSADKQRPR